MLGRKAVPEWEFLERGTKTRLRVTFCKEMAFVGFSPSAVRLPDLNVSHLKSEQEIEI
jgi:hypothetical protein